MSKEEAGVRFVVSHWLKIDARKVRDRDLDASPRCGICLRNSITYHKVDAGGSDSRDDIDLLHEEEVDDNLRDGIEGNTHVYRHGARDNVKVVGLDQHGSD